MINPLFALFCFVVDAYIAIVRFVFKVAYHVNYYLDNYILGPLFDLLAFLLTPVFELLAKILSPIFTPIFNLVASVFNYIWGEITLYYLDLWYYIFDMLGLDFSYGVYLASVVFIFYALYMGFLMYCIHMRVNKGYRLFDALAIISTFVVCGIIMSFIYL